MTRYQDIEVTLEEIEDVKKEFLETKTYIGTDKPVVLDDKTAEYVVRGRKRHEAYLKSVHSSHDMCEWREEVMAPVGTPRFYSYRCCNNCEGEQYHHPAGRFIDKELKEECVGA